MLRTISSIIPFRIRFLVYWSWVTVLTSQSYFFQLSFCLMEFFYLRVNWSNQIRLHSTKWLPFRVCQPSLFVQCGARSGMGRWAGRVGSPNPRSGCRSRVQWHQSLSVPQSGLVWIGPAPFGETPASFCPKLHPNKYLLSVRGWNLVLGVWLGANPLTSCNPQK